MLCSTTSTPASRTARATSAACEIVRILVLDRAEARLARSGEALEKPDLGKQRRDVGGELGASG